jgi:dTDP-4-amino-4,6-dideoxygalactose transaminase
MKPIYITEPVLPPLNEFITLLEDIWESKWLTNIGKFHKEVEKALSEYLKVPYISLFSNGTMALVTALKELKITGEVITTPFSFVATTHAIWWNNIKPVFVDIEPSYMNLDPDKIAAAITAQTTAILPVHVYGNPCDVKKIKEIADYYGLKVIYDAAHAFGVEYNEESILNYGDLSILSFHATKVFNTIEGGAIISHDASTKKRIDKLKNFGFVDETTIVAPGINAKMNELQAAFGLLQLKTIDLNIKNRKKIAETYRQYLINIDGISFLDDIDRIKHNYSYFPVFVDKKRYGKSRDELYEHLKKYNIFGRRYFYPLISSIPTYRGLSSAKPENLSVAERIANQVICLPIYPDLNQNMIIKICDIIQSFKSLL